MNIEKYVRELTNVVREMFLSTGSMFQQEHMRFANLFAATLGQISNEHEEIVY